MQQVVHLLVVNLEARNLNGILEEGLMCLLALCKVIEDTPGSSHGHTWVIRGAKDGVRLAAFCLPIRQDACVGPGQDMRDGLVADGSEAFLLACILPGGNPDRPLSLHQRLFIKPDTRSSME